MKYYATVGAGTFLVERTPDGATIDGRALSFDAAVLRPDEAHLIFSTRSARVTGTRTSGGWRVRVNGRDYDVQLEGERARAIRELTGHDGKQESTDLRAPMPGLVVKVLVETGQAVSAGDGLVVVEAMKMENELRAESDGIVAGVDVEPGLAVERGAVLVRFESEAP